MSRRCVTCRQALEPLRLDGVEIDWCHRCRTLWFDRGELARTFGLRDAPTLTRLQAASPCPACVAGGRAGVLWFSTVDAVPVLACLECGGCSVSERALLVVPLGERRIHEASFTCAACGDRYVLSRLGAVAPARCDRCAPRVAAAVEADLWSRLVRLFTR